MDKQILHEKVVPLILLWNDKASSADEAYSAIEQIEELYKAYLEDHPRDAEALVELALAVETIPFADDESAIIYLEQAFSYDPRLSTLLILAYKQAFYGGITEKVLHYLKTFKTVTPQDAALILYAESWYYKRHERNEYERLLKKSITTCGEFMCPHFDLGRIYWHTGFFDLACRHFKAALGNVKRVLTDTDTCNIISVNAFIDNQITGFVVTDSIVKILEEDIIQTSLHQKPKNIFD